ncbi:MAG: hypothetical protein GXO62_03685 [Epsilonproteobacteria bacterium]|nr:hypothetical protein [Campylobacterota bacterium]
MIEILKAKIDIIKTKLYLFAGGFGGSITIFIKHSSYIFAITTIITFIGVINNLAKISKLEKELDEYIANNNI